MEIEAKFLDVDVDALRSVLQKRRATLVHPEVLMRRKVFDYPDRRLEKTVHGWIRVRDESNQITLSYKQVNDLTVHGTQEVNVVVDNFGRTCEFLTDIGLMEIAYQETKRERWQYGDVEVTIDTWPWIPTFVELEAHDSTLLEKAAGELGFAWSDVRHGSVDVVYPEYYAIAASEPDGWPQIVFSPVPDWLAAKKKHS